MSLTNPQAQVLGGAIAGGASIAGNLIQGAWQSYNDRQARQWQERQVDKANRYNSPSAVMARMKQAGINPNLLAGQPVASSAPVPSASQGSRAPNFDDIAPNVLNTMSGLQPIHLANVENEFAEVRT